MKPRPSDENRDDGVITDERRCLRCGIRERDSWMPCLASLNGRHRWLRRFETILREVSDDAQTE